MKTKHYGSLLSFTSSCLLVFVFCQQTAAQTTIVSDGFNGATTIFTRAGGQFFTGNSAAGDRPASSPFASEGTGSVGVVNGTVTLTATNNINTTGFTNIQLSLRVAAFGLASTSNGVDVSDNVVVEISTNGGTNYTTILTLNGAPTESGADNDCNWAYSATASGSTAYPTAATFTSGNGTGGGTRTTDGYSTLIITSLPATSTLKVRITADNNQTSEQWVMDDFKITGIVASPSITNFSPTSGCANTASVVITGTNFTGATSVKFGGTNALSFTVNSATQITATPATGTSGTISVTTPNGTGTSASSFTINPLPTITGNTTVCGGLTTTLSGSGTAASNNPWISATTTVATVDNNGVVTGLATGTSVITYTNNLGCSNTTTVTVRTTPTATLSSKNNIQCFNTNTGQIIVTGNGGTPPYLYSIDNGANYQPGGTFNNLPVGDYKIRVKDNNGTGCASKPVQ
jgi:hypothetical protein